MDSIKLSKRFGKNIGIYFAEDHDPLAWAAFGAFTSRNNGPFESLLERVNEVSIKRIIEETYIGYGHSSIGDLVDIKMFVEGLPIWLAFELEGFSRFRGQESSTRYIDFAKLPLNPYYVEKGLKPWYDEKIKDYVEASQKVLQGIIDHSGLNLASPDYSSHIRAMKARTFDITRSLIPSIAATNMTWFGNVREIREQLQRLQHLPFVNEIVEALNEQYPQTIPNKEPRTREPWASPPKYTGHHPTSIQSLSGTMDFGSLRDLNRHRVGLHEYNYEKSTMSFHSWYLEKLEAHDIFVKNPYTLDGEGPSYFDSHLGEGLHPPLLGQTINYTYHCDMEQARYLSVLRTKKNVHPTLRFSIINQWKDSYLQSIMDTSPDVGPFGYILVRGNDFISFQGKEL